MKRGTIRLSRYTDAASLKMLILRKFSLFVYGRDCVAEFGERLGKYFEKNESARLRLVVDRDRIEAQLQFLSEHQEDHPIPEGYRPGDPHNRWLWDPLPPMTPEQVKTRAAEREAWVRERLETFERLLEEIRLLGGGNIAIEDHHDPRQGR